jgi:hypothetical protein
MYPKGCFVAGEPGSALSFGDDTNTLKLAAGISNLLLFIFFSNITFATHLGLSI